LPRFSKPSSSKKFPRRRPPPPICPRSRLQLHSPRSDNQRDRQKAECARVPCQHSRFADSAFRLLPATSTTVKCSRQQRALAAR
jgi:hypothetical protein